MAHAHGPVRVHRYRVDPDSIGALLEQRARVIESIRTEHPGLLETRLIELEDETYIDIWRWESSDQMRSASASAASIPEAGASMALTTDAIAHSGTIIDER